jgi:hypothetical protein
MPYISIQQAYALALGAYASPNGNSSFTIQGSNGLPTNKTRLTGLLTTQNIDLKVIPAESGDTPFNPPSSTYLLSNSLETVTEFTAGGGSSSQIIGQAGRNTSFGRQGSKFLGISTSDAISGNLTFGLPVYISSSAANVSPDVFPSSSNITVTPVVGPFELARVRKTGTGTIGLAFQRAYNGELTFWSDETLNYSLLKGLDLVVTGATGSAIGFNTSSPNKPRFNTINQVSYEAGGIDPYDPLSDYFVGEYTFYNGTWYICIADTGVALDPTPTNTNYWEVAEDLTTPTSLFQNIVGATPLTAVTSINGIAVIEIQIPKPFYDQYIINERGRREENPMWMPTWISIGTTTVVDQTSGGGPVGNQCGTLNILPLNDAYTKGSSWLLELSQACQADFTYLLDGGLATTFQAILQSDIVFTTITGGSTSTPRLVYLFGGDINSSGSLTQTEKNYHRTGIGIVNKLKK